jgi:hypothetical protein
MTGIKIKLSNLHENRNFPRAATDTSIGTKDLEERIRFFVS